MTIYVLLDFRDKKVDDSGVTGCYFGVEITESDENSVEQKRV